jgi:putative SOS response-associated peptidase YedK
MLDERRGPMCGRYVVAGQHELSERFQLRQIPMHLMPTFNAAPSQKLPVIVEDAEGERELRLLRWGLMPRWRKSGQTPMPTPINARAETLFEKPMFRGLVKQHRCLVPASGFFEWQRQNGHKQPFYIAVQDEPLVAFAGLYDDAPPDQETGSFTIITTNSNDLVAPLHERMPVILLRTDEATWLAPDLVDPGEIDQLLRPYPAAKMIAYPVSSAVNNVRNNRPDLIEPIAEPDQDH